MIKKHIKREHKDKRFFQCGSCSFSCKTELTLQNHKNKTHACCSPLNAIRDSKMKSAPENPQNRHVQMLLQWLSGIFLSPIGLDVALDAKCATFLIVCSQAVCRVQWTHTWLKCIPFGRKNASGVEEASTGWVNSNFTRWAMRMEAPTRFLTANYAAGSSKVKAFRNINWSTWLKPQASSSAATWDAIASSLRLKTHTVQHWNRISSERCPFACDFPECTTAFKTIEALLGHKRLVHRLCIKQHTSNVDAPIKRYHKNKHGSEPAPCVQDQLVCKDEIEKVVFDWIFNICFKNILESFVFITKRLEKNSGYFMTIVYLK